MPYLYMPGDNFPHIPVDSRVHADEGLKRYPHDTNPAIHSMTSYQTLHQMNLELRHFTICLPQQLEYQPTWVGSSHRILRPDFYGYSACIMDFIHDQPILCER